MREPKRPSTSRWSFPPPPAPGEFTVITGTEFDDSPLVGTSGDDQIYGLGGSDLILGGGGNDQLFGGGGGNDRLSGGAGNDSLFGGLTEGILNYTQFEGGEGDDLIYAQVTRDNAYDQFVIDFYTGHGTDEIVGLEAGDRLAFTMDGFDSWPAVTLIGEAAFSGAERELRIEYVSNSDGPDDTILQLDVDGDGSVDSSLIIHGGRYGFTTPETYNFGFDFNTTGHIAATQYDDSLQGTDGDDTIDGLGGDDWITGGQGNDTLSGGAGNDVLDGGFGDSALFGGAGNDHLTAFFGDYNTLSGDAGDDLIEFAGLHAHADGGDGDDRFRIGSESHIARTVDGGSGTDFITWEYEYEGVTRNIAEDFGYWDWSPIAITITSIEGVIGTAYADYFLVNPADREVVTLNLILEGGAGDDVLMTGAGNDRLYGGQDNDYLFGNSGKDLLDGGTGDDYLSGGNGNDVMFGRDGNDTLIGDSGDDFLRGNTGDDILYGGDGADFLDGGVGVDFAYYGGASEGVIVDLVTVNSASNAGAALGDILKFIEGVTGTDYADTISGSARGNTLNGGSGNDDLIGRNGNDTLNGGFGNDRLFGGNGADTLHGQGDNDILFGGGGRDFLIGGDGDDDLRGQAGDDVLFGEAGDDVLLGHEGVDQLEGGDGDDILDGAIGNDSLFGGAGNDLLSGGNNNDLLNGEAGDDVLIGGNGADTYVFQASHDGTDQVIGLDTSDMLLFGGFGYADVSDVLAFLTQQGNNAVFSDQGVTIVFNGRTVADIEAAIGNAGSSVFPDGASQAQASSLDILRDIETFDFAGLGEKADADAGPAYQASLLEYAWRGEMSSLIDIADTQPVEHHRDLSDLDGLHHDMIGADLIALHPEDGFSFIA